MQKAELYNVDLNEIVINQIMKESLYPHQIQSMNSFYTEGLNLILTKLFKVERVVSNTRTETEMDRKIATIKFEVGFSNVNLTKPYENNNMPLMPVDCRLKDKSYCGYLSADINVKATAYMFDSTNIVKEAKLDSHIIAELPIMVGSVFCHTNGFNPSIMEKISEDPGDPKGNFIINGSEWFVNNLISHKFNTWYPYHNEHNRMHSYVQFISQPGDSFENSSEIIIRYTYDDEILLLLSSDKYFKELQIPFYVVLKLFGMVTEKCIIDNIAGDSFKLREILENAFLVKPTTTQQDLRVFSDFGTLGEALIHELALKYVATKGYVSLEDRQKHTVLEQNILKEVFMLHLDNNVFPHIGKAPEHRFAKALFMCIGIRKLLECFYDIIPSTDRDSHETKRIQPSGDSFAKMFKKEFNRAIVNPLRSIFDDMASKSSFNDFDLIAAVKAGCKSSSLKSRIISNLNQGMTEKIIDGQLVKNRMPSENLKRKNHLTLLNSGTIQRSLNSAQVFSNERSKEIREVQSSQIHTSCVIQTSEGASVGMLQNTTMGMKISTFTSPEIMKKILLELTYETLYGEGKENVIIPFEKVIGVNYTFTKVSVNGLWIGYVKKAADLYKYFRNLRRGYNPDVTQSSVKIDRKLTMCWNNIQKELDFRTDRGRGLAPMIVVYNNNDIIGQKILGTKCNNKTGEGFEQRILVTHEHIMGLRTGKITTEDLFKQGMIDYIAPEELRQVVCAETLEELGKNKHNFYLVYTHLCIPATLLSIMSSLTPFLHNGPPTRAALAGNHIKQACGLYATNFNKRFDKQGYILLQSEFPLVHTITNRFSPAFGQNTIVAILPYGGENVEDSLVLNISAAQRGAFNVNKYTFIKITTDKDEIIRIPDIKDTDNIKDKIANYSKLGPKGYVPIGTKVVKGDVLIGKIAKYTEINIKGMTYRDTSEIYDEEETAYVAGVETGVDGELNIFVKIRLEIPRVLSKGQKFASRNGQKGMTAAAHVQSDMPFTSDGIVPTFILGPHAFPSRMTINQLYEGIYSKLGAITGQSFDGSFSVKTNIKWIGEELEKNGYKANGTEIMYCGRTGKYMNCNTFISPTYYCRLQKFSEEGAYAVGDNGQKSFVTRQPISGRARNGGIRLGEMENHCLHSHGAIRFLHTKLREDCDKMTLFICRNCGSKSIANEKLGLFQCKICGPKARIIKLPTRFASHLLLSMFEGLGVRIKYITQPYRMF